MFAVGRSDRDERQDDDDRAHRAPAALLGGVPAEIVGNFGPPAIASVLDAGEGTVLVAEVSSFQLSLCRDFHPRVAVLLNITPDHVDWHGSMQAYAADKAKVFANLGPGDTAVIDVDDPGSAPACGRSAAARGSMSSG